MFILPHEVGFGLLSNMPSMSELGQVSKQFWAPVSLLKNGSNSIFLLDYEGKMS